jgi:hypothetical protein
MTTKAAKKSKAPTKNKTKPSPAAKPKAAAEMTKQATSHMRPRMARIYQTYCKEGEEAAAKLCKELVVAPARQARWFRTWAHEAKQAAMQ